jgi:GAF domain-containing protein
MNVLAELQECLGRSGTVQQKLQAAAAMLRASGNYRWVGLYVVNHEKGLLRNLVWDGPSAPEFPEFPIDKGLTGRAVATRKTVNVGDVNRDADYLTALTTTKSEIIVPIFDDSGRVVGTIDVESGSQNAFTAQKQALLEECARLLWPLWAAGS